MSHILTFIAGCAAGGAIGVVWMCALQINRNERKDDKK